MGRWTLIVTLPVVIALAAAGGSVLALYGPGFRSGALWLTLLALANATSGLFAAAENALMLLNPRANVLTSLLTVGVQSAAVLVFSTQWGLVGAAAAVLLASLFQAALRLRQVSRRVAWRWRWDTWVAPALAGSAGLIVALAARSVRSSTGWDLAAAAAGIAVYVLVLRRLGLDAEDGPIFAALWRKLR
jgi:O-antigen/teichoic acid export membrane protein